MGAKVNGRLTPGPPVQILPPFGGVLTLDGRPLPYDKEAAERLLEDRKRRSTPLVHNFEHEEDPRYGKDAAGESTTLELRPDGSTWALDPAWTDAALECIRSGAKTWISPEIYMRSGKLQNLRAIALVSTPNLDGLERVTASADAGPWDMPVTAIDCEEKMEPDEVLAEIRRLLGLPVMATEAEINEQISRLCQPGVSTSSPQGEKENENMPFSSEQKLGLADGASTEDTDKAVATKLAAQPVVPPEVAERLDELSAQVTQLNNAAAAAKQQQNAARVRAIVEKAMAEGKITVAQRGEWFETFAALSPDGAEKCAASLPVQAPVRTVISSSFTPITLLQAESTLEKSGVDHQKVLAYRAAHPLLTYEQAYLAVTQPGA